MCRELKREPVWVAAIRLALLSGRVDVAGVMVEANLVDGRERTVVDVLETLAERDLLDAVDGESDTYRPGAVLVTSDRSRLPFERASENGVHRWGTAG